MIHQLAIERSHCFGTVAWSCRCHVTGVSLFYLFLLLFSFLFSLFHATVHSNMMSLLS